MGLTVAYVRSDAVGLSSSTSEGYTEVRKTVGTHHPLGYVTAVSLTRFSLSFEFNEKEQNSLKG